MGTARLFKYSRYQNLAGFQVRAANGAAPPAGTVQTVAAAVNMHEPALAGHTWKSRRFYPLAAIQPGGADRTDFWITRGACFYGGFPGFARFPGSRRPFFRNPVIQAVTGPNQDQGDYYPDKQLNNVSHVLILTLWLLCTLSVRL
jgi:hypothetical protein